MLGPGVSTMPRQISAKADRTEKVGIGLTGSGEGSIDDPGRSSGWCHVKVGDATHQQVGGWAAVGRLAIVSMRRHTPPVTAASAWLAIDRESGHRLPSTAEHRRC